MIWPLLAVQAGVFALWAVLAFRALLRLLARARAASSVPLPGPGAGLRGLSHLLTEPEFRADRRALAVLTLVLLGLSWGLVLLS